MSPFWDRTLFHMPCALGPSVERGDAVQAAMRGAVILPFNPAPKAGVDRREVACVGVGERWQQLHPYGPEPAFLLALGFRVVRARMNQGDAQLGANELQVLRSVGGSVVDK